MMRLVVKEGHADSEGEGPRRVPLTFAALPEVIVQGVLASLETLSLVRASRSSKMMRREAKAVAKIVVEHLRGRYYANRFVLPAEMLCDDEEPGPLGRVGHLDMMWRMTKQQEEVLVMGGLSTNEVTKMTIEQDGTMRFEASTPMLLARSEQAVVYHQGEVLSIGANSTAGVATLERLDTLTQTRTQLAERLPNNLKHTAAAILDNKLLVIGGKHQNAGLQQGSAPSDIVYELEEHATFADQGTWRTHEARLNTARYWACAAAFQGKLWVCGGWSATGILRSVESFDPLLNVWRLEEDMTEVRANLSLFVWEDELYAVGGNTGGGNTTIEKLSKDTRRWQFVADLGARRTACAAALVGSKIILFGGSPQFGERKANSTYDFFDLRTKKWASQDVGGVYFDEATRQPPRQVWQSRAVLITPPAAKFKTWTHLHQPQLKTAV